MSISQIHATLRPPGRPTWLEIDLAALADNVRSLRRLVGETCQLTAVVKANAYGHGATIIAPAALAAGADRLAVATLGEGAALRQAGVTAPVLLLGYAPPWQAADLVRQELTATVYSLEVADALAQAAGEQGVQARVHVKVDTGMHRLGLPPEEVSAFLAALAQRRHLVVEGIYTHFSTADEADKRFTRRQFERFTQLLARLEEQGLRPPLAHAANSAATLSLPETRLEMVRCGIALYGLHPSPETPLPPGFRPVLSWKAQLAQVKPLEAGEPVSYGNTYVAPSRRTIGVIPVGYADGFPRAPRHWQSVLVHGQAAPILGRVCMDQTVIDVTEVRGPGGRPAQAGDEVVLIGAQGGARLSAETVAQRTGTINYEVTSRLLARLPRVVVGGG